MAHGMKTSYKDFILWYFRKYWEEAKQIRTPNPKNSEEVVFETGLLMFTFDRNLIYSTNSNRRIENISELESLVKESSQSEINFPAKLKIKSPFLRNILFNILEKKWVDIENIYFQELKKHLKSFKLQDTSINSSFITEYY
ncbi:MAG: hypothetical protein IPK25_10345 [Saprospiraceae bacterium]|nr:hypothetical protein [Saprospiraceae bacterium]